MLNTVQVQNLGKEHNVGLFNCEISILGKKNFETASQKFQEGCKGNKRTDSNATLG